jgi:glutamate--cysteine ligase
VYSSLLKEKPLDTYKFLNNFVHKNIKTINEWLFFEYQGKQRPIYSSVDIRNAGFKVAPVDTNLFPAGFNNLDAIGSKAAQTEFAHFLGQYWPKATKILIIPENFTRNLNYFKNLFALKNLLSFNDLEIMLGSPFIDDIQEINENFKLTIYPLKLAKNKITLQNGWKPDLIILNNDLTSGVPEILQNITQPIIPKFSKGWHSRRKHTHFEAYNRVIERFSSEFKLDPWLISTFAKKCGQLDFRSKNGLECIAFAVEKLIHQIKQKYNEYNITSEPYIYVKANNGTFGIGIMTVKSGEDLLNINKKKRHSMNVIKEGVQNREVIIQEGVPTLDYQGGTASENIGYLVNGKIISVIKRSNSKRDQYTNLNSLEATFSSNSNYKYGIETLVAELATIATLYE